MITIDRASKVFLTRDGEDIVALKDASLTIGDCEFIALVGPSGCGKSTLLRLIGGLLPLSNGTITIDGATVTGPREDTGIVFQAPTLLPWATIKDNVLFPLSLMGKLQPDSKAKASQLLDMVGLGGFEQKYPRELSGGMQQRAAICRALLHDPSVLLMDEPFGALDALTREELTLELLRIWTERPKTIVFVTHSIPEAVLLADRVVVMSPRPGQIVEIIDVPLSRPRSFDQEGSEAFQGCARRIRELIFGRRGARAA